jgi:hypothetical protein
MSMIIDGTSGVTFPNSTVQASAGSVLQVVNTTFQATGASNYFSTASTSFVTTGLAVSITPKFSTSKILVIVTGLLQSNASANGVYITVYRNSTNLATGTSPSATAYIRSGGGGVLTTPTSTVIYDSPATTSSTTYTVYAAAESGATCTFGPTPGAVNGSQGGITLMEIAA